LEKELNEMSSENALQCVKQQPPWNINDEMEQMEITDSGSLPKLEELYLEQNKIGAGSTFSWKNYDFFSNKHFQHNHMIT
jgi:hypothetical protein